MNGMRLRSICNPEISTGAFLIVQMRNFGRMGVDVSEVILLQTLSPDSWRVRLLPQEILNYHNLHSILIDVENLCEIGKYFSFGECNMKQNS